MNGGMNYPAAFRRQESILTRARVAISRASAGLLNALIAGKKCARVSLVANERTRLALPRWRHGEVAELPENGVDLDLWTALPAEAAPAAMAPRFVFVGRLVDWKRLDLAIRAIAQLPDAQLEVIGDGVMRASWVALTEVAASSPESIISGFVEAARKLAADGNLRARLGAAGRDRVASLFDWNRNIDRILEIYQRAIG
jgi:glycosyltransferase involved in cell wall biosynthesis